MKPKPDTPWKRYKTVRKDGATSSFYDLFRFYEGMIVEHWDTIEAIAPREEWKNENGKF